MLIDHYFNYDGGLVGVWLVCCGFCLNAAARADRDSATPGTPETCPTARE